MPCVCSVLSYVLSLHPNSRRTRTLLLVSTATRYPQGKGEADFKKEKRSKGYEKESK